MLIEDQELQINGFILIIDWSNFSFKQASKLTPSILKLAIEGLQVGGGLYMYLQLLFLQPVIFASVGTGQAEGWWEKIIQNALVSHPLAAQIDFQTFNFDCLSLLFQLKISVTNMCVTYCSIKEEG